MRTPPCGDLWQDPAAGLRRSDAILTNKNRAEEEMVCLACLLPLFLIPVVNALPLLFHVIVSKIYRLLGWEYRKPERAPPACPYKPTANRNNESTGETPKDHPAEVTAKTSPCEDDKQE